MRPGWLNCDEQHEYLKAHVQGFEDTMKDPLARRNWNAAFNQGWEEKWALGKTLRKNIGSWFRQQLIWRGTYEVVHFTMARFGHENGSSATSRKRRYLKDQPKATADPPAPSQENGSSTTLRERRQLCGKVKATADPPAPSQENRSSTTSRECRQLRGKAKATADFPAPSPQRSPPGGTSSQTLARSSKVNRSSGKSRQNQRSGGQPKAAADPPASSVPLARHQYLRSPGLASQNVGSSCQGAAEESGPAEPQDPAKRVPPFVASALFALAKLSVMNQSPPLATQSPRSRPSSRRKADAKALPSNEACVVSPRVCKPTVYKQVAYGKLFLTWDLPGFCNSDVVVAIQGRRISVLASRQAVATVFEWEEEQDCNIDINHIQCGMSCGRLRLAASMKAQEACDATHDSGRFEVSVGLQFSNMDASPRRRWFARVDPDSDFNFTLDEDGWITRVGYPKAEEPSGANPSLLSLIIDGPDGRPKFQKLARLREHLLFHVPIHVHAKHIFTLVNEGPNAVVLRGCFGCKALSTNDSHTVDLIDLTYSSGDEADLGHVVDQGGAHATGCIQHTPATKPGKAAPATGAKPRPSVHQKCLVVADIAKERGHPAPSEKIAEASGAGKGAMRRMTADRQRRPPNKRRNTEEASRRSGPYASSQRAASGGGYQPKATEAKEHLRRMVESLEEPQIEENQVGTGKEITIGSKVNVYYVLKVWNGAAFEVFCSLTSHVPAMRVTVGDPSDLFGQFSFPAHRPPLLSIYRIITIPGRDAS
ncbi:hypothetical protein EYR36_005085 [Pleurotus pulmonarius]|nr:hypothetical protein EYR36_005085 [Pleurotus pulmonarius]